MRRFALAPDDRMRYNNQKHIAKEHPRIMKETAARLNRSRITIRRTTLLVAVVELAAFAMIVLNLQTPGLIVGIVALLGGMYYKRKLKRQFQSECSQAQAMASLGMKNAQYTASRRVDAQWLKDTRLIPTSTNVVQPLLQHIVEGEVRGMKVMLGEITFGVMEKDKKQPTWSTGVLAQVALERPVEKPTLLLGRIAFRHAALRDAYAADQMVLSGAGGREEGWYALTPDGSDPDSDLTDAWSPLCTAVKQQGVAYVGGTEMTAFFLGSFITGVYPLDQPITEATLSETRFEGYDLLLSMITRLKHGK